jgi:arylsulfatase A-like enzyme
MNYYKVGAKKWGPDYQLKIRSVQKTLVNNLCMNSRSSSFVSQVLFSLFTILITTFGVSLAQGTKGKKPNIVVFMVDDMGWQDTSVPFSGRETPLNKRYHTPNMERLARTGMKFTNAYATPLCTPTRVSLLIGMNAAHHRITNWTNIERDKNTDGKDETFDPVAWNINGFSPVKDIPRTTYGTPLPKLLKESGYFTIHAGKAHWGSMGTPGSNAMNVGYVVNIGGHAAGHPQSYQGRENFGNLLGKISYHAVPDMEEYYGSDTFLSEALTIEALKALADPVKNKQPFFLHMAHYAVHTPLQADQRFYQKYLNAGLDSTEAKYATLIEGMDKSLGDILDYLEEKNLVKNTVILFISDNGGLSLSPPRGGGAHTQNLPLKAGKGSVHEGGIRVPMLVKWPGVVKENSTCEQYLIIEDFFPTILEIAGIENPKTIQDIDGTSFVRYLKNPSLKDSQRSLIWHFPNRWAGGQGPGINYVSAIRKGDWKLVYLMKEQRVELYNLAEDLEEHKDLSKENPKKTTELALALTKKLKIWNAQMPKYKDKEYLVKWPDEM